MNDPTSAGGLFGGVARPRSRSWAAVAASAAVHAALVAAAVSAARDAVSSPMPRPDRPLMFFSIRLAPDPALLVPIEPVHLPALIENAPNTEEPAPLPVAPPLPETRVEPVARVEPAPTPPAPEPRRELPKPIEPAKPVVTVGTFASDTPAAHAFEPPRPVERAGFDAPAARAPDIKTATAKVGAFDQSAAPARPQPGSDRPNIVSEAGFGTAMSAPPSRQAAARTVADAGFGRAAEEAPKSGTPRAVQSADFDARPAPAAARAPREVRIDTPLEILSKPTPEYTDEARKLKIEGDVLLEIDFCASGEIRVMRVVRGLGHGLDEAATRAAQGMRFKAAQSNGRPVDFRTTVHIVFRLA